jgi:hypothetical protein
VAAKALRGLVSGCLGQGSVNISVRSERGSLGDGLKLAFEVGTKTNRGMNSYYGHLLAAPLLFEDVSPRDCTPLAQFREFVSLLDPHQHLTKPQKANTVFWRTKLADELETS